MPTQKVERLRALILKEMSGNKLDEEEENELRDYLQKSEENRNAYKEWSDLPKIAENLLLFEELGEYSDQQEHKLPAKKRSLLRRINVYWFAAASILIIGAFFFLYTGLLPETAPGKQANGKPVGLVLIQPARQQAMLTVAGGATYVLDSVNKGQQIEGATKSADGSLEYLSKPGDLASSEHKVSTPQGGFYNLVLVDGTHVWLNAATELVYNPSMSGDTRKVLLKGEAFFQVSKDKKPFVVETSAGEIKVYGTAFNIKSYPSEKMVTTLSEGSISYKNATSETRMQPGNQVQVTKNGHLLMIPKVDVRMASKWKDGYFAFSGTNLSEVLSEVSRWYNVKVVYRKSLPNSELTGLFDRKLVLQELLGYIQKVSKTKMSLIDDAIVVE